MRRVHRRPRLDLAPALRQAADVDRVETDLLDQLRHDTLGVGIVAGDRDRQTVSGATGLALLSEDVPADGVEGLDYARPRQVFLQQLASGRAVFVELGEVSVAEGIVVLGVDDDLAVKWLAWQ